jgi:hypothetical protein
MIQLEETMKKMLIALSLGLAIATLPASAKNLYIPIAGVAPGANGTLFRTDVRIFNPSATDTISISIHFLPAGLDGSNIPGRLAFVAPRHMAVFNDIVGTFMQMPAPAIGAIRLDSDNGDSYEFTADSRTYTDSPNVAAPGTFGQFVPALDPSAAVKKSVVLHVSSSRDLGRGFRANAGVMNPFRDGAVTVIPSLYKNDGTLLASGPAVSIPNFSVIHQSLPAWFGEVPDFEDGYIVFDATAPLFAYASVVDNRSSDQTFYMGAEDKAGVAPIF